MLKCQQFLAFNIYKQEEVHAQPGWAWIIYYLGASNDFVEK